MRIANIVCQIQFDFKCIFTVLTNLKATWETSLPMRGLLCLRLIKCILWSGLSLKNKPAVMTSDSHIEIPVIVWANTDTAIGAINLTTEFGNKRHTDLSEWSQSERMSPCLMCNVKLFFVQLKSDTNTHRNADKEKLSLGFLRRSTSI